EVGGTLVSICRFEPSIVINRAIGCGMSGPASAEEIAEVVALYRAAGVERFFFHIHHLAEPQGEIRGWCSEAGLEKYRGWMKFQRGTKAVQLRETDLRIALVGEAQAEAFGRIAGGNFGLGEAAFPLIGRLVEHPSWQIYMSFDKDRPAGAGGLFLDSGIGWCDWGATDEAYRGRGSQSALLSARLNAAIEAGCKAVATETGEAVPGDPQHSYNNILRAGFKEVTLRENWVPRG
ncbi:MAG: hypothetical protein R3245_01835, partial [Kiloniellales bacterium]|nr:hypothetical protein [Kiloniellales bacterium]